MNLFNVLSLIGGLCLFLFGMNLMGDALERRAGSGLRTLLSRLTSNRILGFLTGLAVTAVIQSSSATTVMVVGFVNSGLLSLSQAIGVIMGANVGTTVTAWILSLGGIEGDAFFLQLLKPTNFTPILALIGICMHMFLKSGKSKDTGTILLGFAVLMFGMDNMSAAVVHLLFNVIGTTICLALYLLIDWLVSPAILGESATYLGISICHTLFNIVCTGVLLPSGSLPEKLVCFLVPDAKESEKVSVLDERLLNTPSIALERCHILADEMAESAAQTLRHAINCLNNYDPTVAKKVRDGEAQADKYEDILGTYLVKLSAQQLGDGESAEAAMLLKAIGDFERISDHSVSLLCSAEELKQKRNCLFRSRAAGIECYDLCRGRNSGTLYVFLPQRKRYHSKSG